MTTRLLSRVLTAVLWAVVPAASAHAGNTDPPAVYGDFEGQQINLSEGWGEAHACVIAPDGTRCYRTEAELDTAEGGIEPGGMAPMAACSSKLRLYDGTSYTGDVLELQVRYVVHNLSAYGFNNVTSSYKVGGCSSEFYDTTGGSTIYPGNTSAWAQASSMQSGWNNSVGSVYIQ